MQFLDKARKARQFVGPEVWKLFILAVFIGVLWFLVESSFVIIIQSFLFSIGLIQSQNLMIPHWFPSDLKSTTIILISFGIFRGIVIAMKYFLAITTSEFFIAHQKSQILQISLRYSSQISTHETMLAFSEYTHSGAMALQQLALLINNFVSIILFVIGGFYLTPKEFILSVVLLAMVTIPIKFLNQKLRGLGKVINQEKENATQVLVTGLKNNFFLQIYHLIEIEIQRGMNSLDIFQKNYRLYGKVGGLRNAFPQIFGAIVIAIVAFISIKYFHTPGAKLLSFFYILIRMSQCTSDFYSTSGDIRIHTVGLKKLYEWNLKLEEFNNQYSKDEKVVSEKNLEKIKIEIEDISFSYDSILILKNITLTVKPSEVLLIRGESGAGKSTLLSLILGLNTPSSGKILINAFEPISIRSHLATKVGYVGPEPFLISGSVRDNLLYGHPHPELVSDNELWDSLERAQLKNEIQSLPRQLEENLLERTQFSTGQKQRLSIARALVRKPSLLVLDEATANLDPETEAKFIELLSTITKDMTSIIVTHKDSFNQIATQKITLLKS